MEPFVVSLAGVPNLIILTRSSGKARRGDGNDLTANPKKLAAIGKELEMLSRVINDLTPVSEMPFGARCKSR